MLAADGELVIRAVAETEADTIRVTIDRVATGPDLLPLSVLTA